MTILAFVSGLLIGGFLGILVMALCAIAGREEAK